MSEPLDVPELTPRVCRYCRTLYLAEKGSRPHACANCAPTIEMMLAGTIDERARPGAPVLAAPRELGDAAELALERAVSLPPPPDRFAGECDRKGCSNIAEVLFEGGYLCGGCADDLLDRMVAADVSPELAAMLPAFWEA